MLIACSIIGAELGDVGATIKLIFCPAVETSDTHDTVREPVLAIINQPHILVIKTISAIRSNLLQWTLMHIHTVFDSHCQVLGIVCYKCCNILDIGSSVLSLCVLDSLFDMSEFFISDVASCVLH